MFPPDTTGWKPIPDFPDYEIDIHGTIRVLPAKHRLVRTGNYARLSGPAGRVKCCIGALLVSAWAPAQDTAPGLIAEMEQLRQRLKEQEARKARLQAQIAQLESRLAQEKKRLQEATQLTVDQAAQITELKQTATALEHKRKALSVRLAQEQEAATAMQDQTSLITELERTVAALRQERDALATRLHVARDTVRQRSVQSGAHPTPAPAGSDDDYHREPDFALGF